MDICPWRRKWQPTPVLLPGKSHRQRSLERYNPWGSKESGRTILTFTTSPYSKRLRNFTFLLVLYEVLIFPHPHQYLLFPIKIYTFWGGLELKGIMLSEEKAMAPHSSTLAWKIPWAEEPGGLWSMGSLRVGHD